MRLGIDGRKIPQAAERGPVASFDHARELGMAGIFFRTVLDMSPTLDSGRLAEIRSRADDLGMYIETGLGKVNPYAMPESPELRAIGKGDTLTGFRRMMEACAAIGCCELLVATADYKSSYPGRFAYDRFRTDVSWLEQLGATQRFLTKLAPIARDLGIHINIETHEEITSFEIVRLIEAVGEDVVGVAFDTGNPLQRAEHPVFAARRVAPYVRQTHIKDIYLARGPGDGLDYQARPCGAGIIDFREILPILAAANPTLNLSLENAEVTNRPSKLELRKSIQVFDPQWLNSHPDITVVEYAAYMDLLDAYSRRIASGAVPDFDSYAAAPFGYAEAIAAIAQSAAHLRAICRELDLPLEDPPQ